MKAKLFCFVVVLLVFLLAFPLTASADKPQIPDGGMFALYNIENDTYLISGELDKIIMPSSSAKLMSGMLICEKLRDRLDENITVRSDMLAGVSGKSLGLAHGMTTDVKSLLYAALGGGYNDAIYVLASAAFGNTGELVNEMNSRAAAIGMYSTKYVNITGLDSPAAQTTVRDIITLASRASENELFLEASSVFTYKITFADNSEKISYGSNLLTSKNSKYYCRSVRGMNSGATGSGTCLVAYAEHGGAGFIALAINYPEDESRYADIQDALDWAYNNYRYRTVTVAGTQVGSVKINNSASDGEEFKAILAEDLTVYSDTDELPDDLRYTLIFYDEKLNAPVTSGDVIGKYLVYDGVRLISSCDVTISGRAESSGVLGFLDVIKNYLTGRAFIAAIIAFVVYSVAMIIIPWLSLTRRQRKRTHVRKSGGFKYKK